MPIKSAGERWMLLKREKTVPFTATGEPHGKDMLLLVIM